MTLDVPKSTIDQLGFDLPSTIESFTQTMAAHALTVDEPAPSAHPLVEEIVRSHGGLFSVIDDTLALTPGARRVQLGELVSAALRQQIDGLASPARRQLAQLDLAELTSRPPLQPGTDPIAGVVYRTDAEQARVLQITALFAEINAKQRHALLLLIELEDLPDDQLEGWQPHSWPA